MARNVAKKEEGGQEVGEAIDLLEQSQGMGQEEVGRDDLEIPRMMIVQSSSDFVKEGKPDFIEGAKPGQLILLPQQTLIDGKEGLLFVPVHYHWTYIEQEEKGGAFVKEIGKSIDGLTPEDGNVFMKSADFFGYIVDEGEDRNHQQAFVRMKSTQLKKARRLNTMAKQVSMPGKGGKRITPPLFCRAYRFTTVPEGNDQGDWFGWVVKPDAFLFHTWSKTPEEGVLKAGKELFEAAMAFHKAVQEGAVKPAASGVDDGERAAGASEDDEAPM